MSDNLPFLYYYTVGLSYVAVFSYLYLQVRAYMRSPHISLLLLVTSSLLAVVGFSLNSAPQFFGAFREYRDVLYIAAAFLLAVQTCISLVGTAMLFNSYAHLAKSKGA